MRKKVCIFNWKHLLLIMSTLVLAIVVMKMKAIPQDPSYHLFADNRNFFNIPNFFDVVSNIPFFIISIVGLVLTFGKRLGQKIFNHTCEKISYIITFSAIGLMSLGSTYYHLWPSNQTILWDRLPITIIITGIFASIIMERINIRLGCLLMPPLIFSGIFSVVYWYSTEIQGIGDLRPYIIIQYCSIILITLIVFMFKSAYDEKWSLIPVILLYGISKIFEVYDNEVHNFTTAISGHTIKHVVAAGALYFLVRIIQKRICIPKNSEGEIV